MTLQDRPTAAELVEAVREFLERDVMGRDELPRRVAFHARVAVNVLAIVGRELTLGSALDAAEHERLVALLGHDGDLDDLTAELARRIRDGSLDDRGSEVVEHLRASVLAKLAVANPEYADR
ncbi:MAG TPA: DUF6285 domain-containing protein [Acidimicrobiia bacterium]